MNQSEQKPMFHFLCAQLRGYSTVISLLQTHCKYTMDTEMSTEIDQENHNITMTTVGTTIDPSVIQSRILQSSSLAQAGAQDDSDDEMDDKEIDQPVFAKLDAMADKGGKVEYRRVRCPKHRYTPLREDWEQILMPLVHFLKLQVRQCSICYVFLYL
jgi:hypothetical protein